MEMEVYMKEKALEPRDTRFKRIATSRTQRILNDLRLLGNCSNKSVYKYSEDDINKIFQAIDKELKRVKASFADGPKDNTFSL
jgi:hypothetical protein